MTHRFIARFLPVTRALTVAVLCGAALAVTGCGMSVSNAPVPSALAASHTFKGTIHGGQQPISAVSVALYAAGTTGIGSASRSMLTSPVISTQNGNFDITGLYSCNPGDQVYLVGTGGNSGAGVNNAIALMAALGPCATLLANQATTYIDVNEVTTIGSVFALAPFMTGIQNVGSDAAHANALAAAFATTKTLVNIANGQALTVSTGNGIVPQTTIDSLANSIASCIDSTLSDQSCANLFAATGPPTATNTIAAVLNIAQNPAANPSGVFLQASATPPFQPTLTTAPASYALVVQHPSDVLLYHNDIGRTGAQTYEQALTPANVNSTQFGKLFTLTVDSFLYAQPLYVGGVGMPDGLVHNLVFAASSRGTVYAFDADGDNPSSGFLWSIDYIPSGERYPVAADYGNCGNPEESGIVGTPVIDRTAQTIYFVVKSITTTGSTFYHRLHAVSLIDGSERTGSPTIINPTFPGTGDGASGGSVPFNGQRQNQRAALLLTSSAGGGTTVWVAYASHCDIAPYHGLLLGYSGSGLTQTAAFSNTPNGSDGGIWESNGGPNADAQGNIYVLGGNGTFDANTAGIDYGDSALRLVPPAAGSSSTQVTAADYFTPSNQDTLSSKDLDFGGTEAILFTDPASGVAPHLMIASDKNGYIYLLDADNLGKYDTGTNGIDGLNGDLQDFGGSGALIGNFCFFNSILYTSNPMHAFAYTPGTSSTAGSFNTTPIASAGESFVSPVVSANGTANTIVWLEDYGDTFYALTASLTQLYSSSQAAGGRDTPPTYVKFTSPVVANGKVYLSGQGSLAVYGELP